MTDVDVVSASPTVSRRPALWAPLPTPLDAAGNLDEPAIDRVVDYLCEAGIGGLWINGTTGEFHALDDAERAAAVARAVSASRGRMTVAAHIGDSSLRRAVDHGRRALDVGADELACMPPYYLAHGQDELLGFFTEVAESLDRPVYLYDFPAYCKVALAPETVASLARSGVAIGIKESGPSLDRFRKVMRWAREAQPDFHCMHGASALFATNLHAGADGAVSAGINVYPQGYVEVLDAGRRGDWPAAQEAQRRINHVWDALNSCVSGRPALTSPSVPAIKAWLTGQGIFRTNLVRAPMNQLTDDERQRLESLQKEAG